MPNPHTFLLTDLYQLTMLQGYIRQGMEDTAVFEFFVRKLPPKRNFLMAAGLEQVLDFLEHARFSDEDLDFLSENDSLDQDTIDYLKNLRFTGDVHAMPEGSIFFPDEPILRVTAPLPQAQLVETRIINILHFQTLIASKAARMHLAGPDRIMVDFGLRRAHGGEAGLFASRACYLAGFTGTSTVEAGKLYNIPIYGTMAHSFIQAHDDESQAFADFAAANPRNSTLLIDTYDTVEGAEKVVRLAPQLKEKGISIKAVRLDSGDLAALAFKVRKILDAGGLPEVKIFASGSLDEYELKKFADAGAPIDGFGIGSRLDTSADAPYLDCAYKLQEYAGFARRKKSAGKATWPGRKQVFRHYTGEGKMRGDELTLEGDGRQGEPLIRQVMANGKRTGNSANLNESREFAARQLNLLPEPLKKIVPADLYEVKISNRLRQLAEEVDARREELTVA